jgi:toxin-antitoxin system PIN domain toxin
VILVDANILLYAYDADSPRQRAAASWLEHAIAEDEVGVALTTVLAFLRICTHASVFRKSLRPADALEIVQSWLGEPSVRLVQPTDRHWTVMADLAQRGQAKGPLLMDAHLAALALEHGAALCSVDRDFSRFPGLRVVDPLA